MRTLTFIFLLSLVLKVEGVDGLLGTTNGTTTLGPGAGGGGSPQAWTNSNGKITFSGSPRGADDLTLSNNIFVQFLVDTNQGGANFTYGLALPGQVGPQIGFSGPYPASGTVVTANAFLGSAGIHNNTYFTFSSTDDGTSGQSGTLEFDVGSPNASITALLSSADVTASGLRIQDSNNVISGVFDGRGNISRIKSIQYEWPGTNALSGQALVSDGNTPQQLSFDYVRVKMTQNNTATVTFVVTGQSETQYDDNGTTIASLAINLPSTTTPGQICRYVTKAIVTSATVNGTVSVGAAVTTLAANSSVAWQATDTVGTFIRIQ